MVGVETSKWLLITKNEIEQNLCLTIGHNNYGLKDLQGLPDIASAA